MALICSVLSCLIPRSSLSSCSLVISVLRSVFSCYVSFGFLWRFTFSPLICSFFTVSFVSLSLSPFVFHWCWDVSFVDLAVLHLYVLAKVIHGTVNFFFSVPGISSEWVNNTY